MATRTRKHLATKSTAETLRFLEKLSGGPLTFGKLIRSIREGEEVSLATFAARLGLSRQKLWDIEEGRRGLSVARAVEWARLLGYSEAQFAELALQAEVDEAGLGLRVHVESA